MVAIVISRQLPIAAGEAVPDDDHGVAAEGGPWSKLRGEPLDANAEFPYSPATTASATFNASVTTLTLISSRRAGRSTPGKHR